MSGYSVSPTCFLGYSTVRGWEILPTLTSGSDLDSRLLEDLVPVGLSTSRPTGESSIE